LRSTDAILVDCARIGQKEEDGMRKAESRKQSHAGESGGRFLTGFLPFDRLKAGFARK